jgi:hypothetical protein
MAPIKMDAPNSHDSELKKTNFCGPVRQDALVRARKEDPGAIPESQLVLPLSIREADGDFAAYLILNAKPRVFSPLSQ